MSVTLPTWHEAHERFLNHLMSGRCCHAPIGRYCPTGAQLLAAYNQSFDESTGVTASAPATSNNKSTTNG